jgi:tRNA-specific 2-thiouridylase
MSGGVDSACAALLLKKSGAEVRGYHMILHENAGDSWERARHAASRIGVPIEKLNLEAEFDKRVISPFVSEYVRGRTPSPCVLCNRFLKMGALLDAALAAGCDLLATGHYVRKTISSRGPSLLRGFDRRKDQSYFLFLATRSLLMKMVFPLGGMTKDRARHMASKHRIFERPAPESQELCFIPDNDYRGFLVARGTPIKAGFIKDLRGAVLGRHAGVSGFTVGQRRGLGIAAAEPLYVVRTDAETNSVYVGPKSACLVEGLRVTGLNWIGGVAPTSGQILEAQVRSTAPPVRCEVTRVGSNFMEALFHKPQSGVSPGQAAVFYRGLELLGGGWIDSTETTRHGR